jgi:hypothetical protein
MLATIRRNDERVSKAVRVGLGSVSLCGLLLGCFVFGRRRFLHVLLLYRGFFACLGTNAAYGGTAELPKEPLASLAWYDSNSRDTTHPVATKLPNGYGLWDMLGNVWEWVQDVGRGPGEHILKGGSFYNIARDVRVSGRLSAPPDLRHRDIGFRCTSSAWPEEKSSEGSTDRGDRRQISSALQTLRR